jgi:hypothetical protein
MLDSRPDAVVVQHLHPDDAIDPILSNVVNARRTVYSQILATPQRVDLVREGVDIALRLGPLKRIA